MPVVSDSEPWTFVFRPGGWVAALCNNTMTAALRLSLDSGRWSVSQLIVWPATGPITGRSLLQIPLREVERSAQRITVSALLQLPPDGLAPYNAMTCVAFFELEPRIHSNAIPAARQPKPLPQFTARFQHSAASRNEFLRCVAAWYLWLTEQGRNPAPFIAESTGRSVRTVHGWIAASRRQGLIPPGRAGTIA